MGARGQRRWWSRGQSVLRATAASCLSACARRDDICVCLFRPAGAAGGPAEAQGRRAVGAGARSRARAQQAGARSSRRPASSHLTHSSLTASLATRSTPTARGRRSGARAPARDDGPPPGAAAGNLPIQGAQERTKETTRTVPPAPSRPLLLTLCLLCSGGGPERGGEAQAEEVPVVWPARVRNPGGHKDEGEAPGVGVGG